LLAWKDLFYLLYTFLWALAYLAHKRHHSITSPFLQVVFRSTILPIQISPIYKWIDNHTWK
jgi:hypothetical protein